MKITTFDSRFPSRRAASSLALTATATVALLTACSPATDAPLGVADWCWLHYRLAPPGALGTDVGPASAAEADAWSSWLAATADGPPERRLAHGEQQRLVERYVADGTWDEATRTAYLAVAHAEPTPATVCETVGARIVADERGSLPPDWERRFRDPNDPAHSELAQRSEPAQ